VALGGEWAKLGERLLGTSERIGAFLTKDRRRDLTQREVVIGTYREEGIAADLRAEIILGERTPPDVDIFLDRLRLKDPYCTGCSRPMRSERAFMAGLVAYCCDSCGVKIPTSAGDLRRDALGAVRRDYLRCWSRYDEEIRHLTGGKPHRWKLPG